MDLKRRINNSTKKYERLDSVLHTILYFASHHGEEELPTIKDAILSEVANGTISYVGGNAGEVIWTQHFFHPHFFETDLWKYFNEEMREHSRGKLDWGLRRAIYGLLKPYWCGNAMPGESNFLSTELYKHFIGEGKFCNTLFQSTFNLNHGLIKGIEDKIIPSFSSEELQQIKGIGESMRQFVEQDLEHIRKRYHW